LPSKKRKSLLLFLFQIASPNIFPQRQATVESEEIDEDASATATAVEMNMASLAGPSLLEARKRESYATLDVAVLVLCQIAPEFICSLSHTH
jgi:hypothetical protein